MQNIFAFITLTQIRAAVERAALLTPRLHFDYIFLSSFLHFHF